MSDVRGRGLSFSTVILKEVLMKLEIVIPANTYCARCSAMITVGDSIAFKVADYNGALSVIHMKCGDRVGD